jgi:putative PIN family toxin of toxin-antitoxin system
VKVVLDTNVIVSGLMYPNSTPGRIVSAWRNAQVDVATSLAQLEEVGRVLAYPKIRKVLRWDQETIETFLKQLLLRMELVEIGGLELDVPGDSSDSPILAALVGSKADFLVTGDGDLLALAEDFPIVRPAEFAKKL